MTCWGTGNPRREFIYCEDAAEGVIQILEKYGDVELPINVGFGEDYSIKELSNIISEISGFKGKILWYVTKPDGQFRKILDSSRMKENGIVIKKTNLVEGLKKTIEWCKQNVEI